MLVLYTCESLRHPGSIILGTYDAHIRLNCKGVMIILGSTECVKIKDYSENSICATDSPTGDTRYHRTRPP